MLPILYKSDTKDFKNNGFGCVKNCTKCVVTEVRNGLYELDLEILTNDRLADTIAVGMFLKALPNTKDEPQIFEIYSISVTDSRITAKAQHIRYIMGGNVISERYVPVSAMTPLETWEDILSKDFLELENFFEFDSDITTQSVVTAAKDGPVRLGDFFSGAKGSMLDVFGGEFHYNNFKTQLLKNRGRDSGVSLRYGSNISSYQQCSDISTVYSHLLPYAVLKQRNAETGESLPDINIYHDLIDLENKNLTYKRALAYDFSDDFQDDTVLSNSGSGAPINWSELREKLKKVADNYVKKNKSALTDISINIVVDVEQTLKGFENSQLCDTVSIFFEPLNFSAKAKIIKTEYDVLSEKYSKIELGTMKKTIADLFDGKNIGGA